MQEIATAPKAKRLPTAGKVQCKVQSQKAATKSTNWYITDDALKPVSAWTKVENKKSNFIFENLVPGIEVHNLRRATGRTWTKRNEPPRNSDCLVHFLKHVYSFTSVGLFLFGRKFLIRTFSNFQIVALAAVLHLQMLQ